MRFLSSARARALVCAVWLLSSGTYAAAGANVYVFMPGAVCYLAWCHWNCDRLACTVF